MIYERINTNFRTKFTLPQRKLSALGIILMLLITLAIPALAKKTEGCPDNPFYGHIGQVVNTPLTETHPIFINNNLLFTRLPVKDKIEKSEAIEFRSSLAPDFKSESQDLSIPMKIMEYSAYPTMTADGKEIFFSATGSDDNKKSRDIYHSILKNGVWSEPTPINSVNTSSYESQPAVAPNGTYLVFVSDRKDGQGKKDLYITFREENNQWSEAVSLGQFINSAGDDVSPFIDERDMVFFSSNGHTQKMGFDILRANIRKPAVEPEALLYPVNTESNENSCCVSNGKIYVSSDRKNGCGGEDIFAYSLCGPAVIEGQISAANELAPREGSLVIEDMLTGEKQLITIEQDGKFIAPVEATHSYLVQYSNPCIKQHIAKKIVNVPCSDTSVVRIQLNIEVQAKPPVYDFTRYEIPFFPTGYYMPLTKNNIDNLKQKFNYKMIGTSKETQYILYPKNVNEKEIQKVEIALKDAASYIGNLVENFTYGCQAYSVQKIVVKITGYCDPRPIAKGSKYIDAEINEYGINIAKNADMNNKTLSILRAYYTAKQIEQYLVDATGIPELGSIIDWQIVGGGTDKKGKYDPQKRRVNIEITVE